MSKVGRKPLNLTPEEWRQRRNAQRHAREEKAHQDERMEIARCLVDLIANEAAKATKDAFLVADDEHDAELNLMVRLDAIATEIANDPTIVLRRAKNKNATPELPEQKGERLKRAIRGN